MDCSKPGFPVHHQLPELAQTQVHWVGDAIRPSPPLSSPSPPTFTLSQHQGLLQRVSSLHQVIKELEFQVQHQSFQWIFKTDFLEDGLVGSFAVQGTLKNLLQHHSSKVSILPCSGFLISKAFAQQKQRKLLMSEKSAHRMEENSYKWCDQQKLVSTIYKHPMMFKSIKNKQPNQQMGKSLKKMFFQRRVTNG